MKKLLTILLVVSIAMCAVFANGDGETSVESKYPHKNIAVVYQTFTDKLGSEFKGSLESIAPYFNVSFNFVETGFNTEEGTAKIDALMQTDVDGIIFVTPNVANLESASKRNIPIIAMNEPVDEATDAQLKTYSNYLGGVVNDDYVVGYRSAQALYDAGCRNICVSYLTPGTSKNHDDRYRGFQDAAALHPDMKILSESASRAQWPAAINTFSAAFPEMDGLFSTAFSEPGYQAIKKNGLVGKVKLATADISESSVDYIENGTICSIFGGQYNKIMLAFAALYNYLYDGTRILDAVGGYVYTPFIQITSAKDYQVYEKYVTGGDNWVYTAEAIEQLICGVNPAMTPQKFEDFAKAYSISQIISLRTAK